MKTQCPHCKAGFNVRSEYAGKKVNCPKCKQSFVVSNYAAQKTPPEIPVGPPLSDADTLGNVQERYSSRTEETEQAKRKTISSPHLGLIPEKIREYLHSEETILYASNPSKGALVLSLILPCLLFLPVPISLILIPFGGWTPSPLEFFFCLIWVLPIIVVYLSWKNRFYLVTDKRTIASEGIFNVAISIIPNKSIQMVCINTGVIDRLLGLNTLEVSSAAHGGTNVFYAFAGKSKGAIKFRAISNVQDVVKIYHPVFA